ncbi:MULTISPECIES: hypothetical protein [unclassified Methylobacterium]|uniref:hypothetical protein n=1 Tax=unclassified Methylobacterium TaxID=2615210 RepID=UPI0036F9A0A0
MIINAEAVERSDTLRTDSRDTGRMTKLVKDGSLTQALAELRGTTIPDPVEEERKRKRERYLRGKAVKRWPAFQVDWDPEPGNFYRSRDATSASDFRAQHPNGVTLGDVPLSELDAALHVGSRRSAQEVWSIGERGKVARAIRHWEDGYAMTPPMLDQASDGTITIAGGHNRLAVARAKGETSVPILFDPARLAFMQGKLPSLVIRGTFPV